MAMQKKLSCPHCSRKFALPAHLARHVNSSHGSGRRKAAARRGRKSKAARIASKTHPAARGLDLTDLSLGQLCHLIDIARAEAGRRLQDI